MPIAASMKSVLKERRKSMDRLEWKGNWNEIKGGLKSKYGELTDDDLAYTEGQEDQLFGRLQQRLGKGRQEIEEMFRDFTHRNRV